MILEDVLCDVKDAVLTTGYFNFFYEYAEMTNTKTDKGTISFPRAYIGDGQYQDLYDFDVNGTGYIRKTGSIQMKETEDITTACEGNNMELIYPLRLVAAVPKDLLNDDAFSDDKLVYEIIEKVQGSILGISNTMKVAVMVDRYETDRNKVWSDEITGLEEIIRPELSYVYLDFNLTINVKRDCLIADCYG